MTPSGQGVRIIGLGGGEKVHRKLSVPNANGVSCEFYRRATRFITVTGNQIGDAAELANINGLFDKTLADLDGKKRRTTKSKRRKHDLDKLIKDGCGDDFEGDRSRAVWFVIHQLLGQGKSAEDVVAVLLNHSNGISAHIYDQSTPEEYARNQVEKAQQKRDDKSNILAELNRDNAVVLDGARTRVLRFDAVPHQAGGERYVYRLPTFLPFDDFRNFYLNRYIEVGDGECMSIGKWWLAQPERRQYRGVIFVPGGEPVIDGRLNLWTGWAVEPKLGEWPLLREHMFEVLAARDDDVDRYNFNWCAWTVQHPAQQAEVALVLRGGIGTGKGTLGNGLCRIFGQHARHLSSPEHLTGKFNAHLRQCCFLFADECYGPSDKKAEGTLKRVITEPTLEIEPKGRDIVTEPNRLHIMMASNLDWVVPAGARERRYVVQDGPSQPSSNAGPHGQRASAAAARPTAILLLARTT